MGQKRRHFTDEFKTEVISLLAGSGRRLVEIAGELGISPSMLRNLRNRQGGQHAGSAVPAKPAGHALRCGSGGGDLPALPRERSAAHGTRHFRKGCGALLGSAEMRFGLIEDQRDVWPVRVLRDALGVSPSGYYTWRSRPESPREIANRELPSDIRRVHAEHRGRYGAPRNSCRTACRGPECRPQADRAGDAPAWHPGSRAASLSCVHHRQQAFSADRGHPARPEFRGREAGSEMLWGERRGSGSFVAGSKLTGVPDASVERLEQIARRSGSG